jgi:alkylation response protein AidB-like acyl-CoA dehydrogenase
MKLGNEGKRKEIKMVTFQDPFTKTPEQQERLQKVQILAKDFRERAFRNDLEASFPFENFNDLKKYGFLGLTIPKKFGGQEISLYEFLQVQEAIAQGDGPTALCVGWHLGILHNLNEQQKWNEETFQKVCLDIIKYNRLINSAQTEPKTGSPTRGGKPETTARKEEGRWVINGRKTYTSLAPALDYFIVSATIIDTDEVADFLVERELPGVQIDKNWDTVGMRSTRSDDLVMDEVRVDEDACVEMKQRLEKTKPQGWLLHIPACYLGIAMAARNEAIAFAKSYQPNSLNTPIMEVPEVKRKVGGMEIELIQARQLLYGVAERWDAPTTNRDSMGPDLAAAKYVATNAAIKVVDLAMRIQGGQSMFLSNPLQRLYRDVRAGIHNPPADDITLTALADRAFKE